MSTQPLSSYHIILKRNDDEFNDYQCPHQQKKQQRRGNSRASRHYRPKYDLIRLPQNRTLRSKRSIDVVASDDFDLDDVDSDPHQKVPANPTAPIQLDDNSINSNDVYEESPDDQRRSPPSPPSSSSSSSSNVPSVNGSVYSRPSSADGDVPFNITVETAVFVDESLYHLLSKTFPIDTEQQIVLYVLTIMNAVQLLFKQPSIGRSVEISVVLMDLLKQQPKVSDNSKIIFLFNSLDLVV